MSNLVRWDPFMELSALQKQFFGDDLISQVKGVNIPTTDVYTKDNEMVVEAHLPNFDEEDVSIQLENNLLVISAARHEKREDKDKNYLVRESSTSFYRNVQLPEQSDADKIEAHFNEGVLKVRVPLTPIPKPKNIAISANTSR
jgi:HSP20 family protein